MANNLNFGNGAKGFLIMHAEKLALGLCVLLVGLFFMLGLNIEPMPEDQTPSKLANLATNALTRISNETFEPLKAVREPATGYELTKELEKKLVPTDPAPFSITASIVVEDEELVIRRQLRGDPRIFPPNQPLASAIVAAIAVDPIRTGSTSSTTGRRIPRKDPLAGLGPAFKIDPEELERQRAAAARAADAGRGFGEESPAMATSSPGASDIIKTFPESLESMIPGWRPGGAGASSSRGGGESSYRGSSGDASASGTPVQMAESFVSVVATMDFEKQAREYEQTLSDTVAYEADFDQPKPTKYEAQVLDITDDPTMNVVPPKITADMTDEEKAAAQEEIDRINQLWNSSSEKVFMAKWGSSWWLDAITPEDLANDEKTFLVADTEIQETLGTRWYGASVPEVADPRYIHPKLTSAIPPVLMHEYEEQAIHPDIPTFDEGLAAEKPLDETPGSVFEMPTGPQDGSSESYRGGRSGSSYEEGGYSMEEDVMVPKKLIRFFHLGAQPGHTYVYRVRVRLIDPNNIAPTPELLEAKAKIEGGASGSSYSSESSSRTRSSSYEGGSGASDETRELKEEIMTSTVRQRLREVRRADELYYQKYGTEYAGRYNTVRITTWRTSDWSVPSAPVTVPQISHDVYAGKVDAASPTRIGRDNYFYKTEPAGNVAVSVWDRKYAVRVPAEQEVQLGSVLNFETDADVLHPMDLTIRRIPGYKFTTDSMVVDMRGGESLPGGGRGESLTSAGEFLLIDHDGNMFAQNELDDIDEYRWSLLIVDEPQLSPDSESGRSYEEGSSSEGYGRSGYRGRGSGP